PKSLGDSSALGAIIAASMGSTLTVRKESKIKELDIN
ncbi:hypothetical protein, partial [Escherichia coli]